ncbi:MAG: hypothetical protein Q4C77_19765 [Eubacteriales bacterium]|nr:hypothetical protein [Eubacteriales bacterium]
MSNKPKYGLVITLSIVLSITITVPVTLQLEKIFVNKTVDSSKKINSENKNEINNQNNVTVNVTKENSEIQSSNVEIEKEESDNQEIIETSASEVWLEELTPLTCIYRENDSGGPISCVKWTDQKDNRGKVYNHGVYVGDSYGSLTYTEVELSYDLEGQYSNMVGTIVLSEQGKDQIDRTVLKIIADNDLSNPRFVTSQSVSSGFIPEEFSIDVTGVNKISFILEGEDDDWYWSRDFGLVDSKLS